MNLINPSLLALIFLPAAAVLPIYWYRNRPNIREGWTLLAGVLTWFGVLSMIPWISQGHVYQWQGPKILPNLPLLFRVDGFGLLFALVASTLWIVTSIYSIGYMRGLSEGNQTRYFAYFAVAISATLGVAFSGNLLTLYIFYELLSLSTYPLVTHHQDQEARGGGRKYLTFLMGTSIGFALPALVISYMEAGTLSFGLGGIFSASTSTGLIALILVLFLFGFAKSGLMPFHVWLPGAMVAPTPISSLLHAVAVVKVGVFCVLRVLVDIVGISTLATTGLNLVVCWIAGVTVIVSSLIALSQDNLKRRLAFSTVGQLAYIILGAGVASLSGVVGSMMHIAAHATGKITLFFCAGAIYVASKQKYISKMAGLGRKMPWTFGAFLIGSLSVIGLPPTGGFVSKWTMLRGSLEAGLWMVMVVYLISTLLNAAYFLPIVFNGFFKSPEKELAKTSEAPLAMVGPLVATAALSIILFFGSSFTSHLARLAVILR